MVDGLFFTSEIIFFILCLETSECGETVAGIVGFPDGTTNIKNCSVTNAELTNSTVSQGSFSACASGIIGHNYSDNNIDKCNVENVTLNGKAQLGGVLGFAGNASISNTSVRNITINDLSKDEAQRYYYQGIGGLVAACTNTLKSTNNSVKDLTINSINSSSVESTV